MTVYTIKRSSGDQAFEVSAPDKDWVEAKAEVFEQQLTSAKPVATKPSKSRSTPSSKSTGTRTVSSVKVESQLRQQLDANTIDQMVEYIKVRQKAFDKTAPNQAVIIAKFLKDTLNIGLIDKEDLAYIYKQVGSWKLVNHGAQLDNATDRNNYLTRRDGKYELSYAGEKFALDTAKDE